MIRSTDFVNKKKAKLFNSYSTYLFVKDNYVHT